MVWTGLIFGVISLIVAVGVIWLLARSETRPTTRESEQVEDGSIVMLFDSGELADATSGGHTLLEKISTGRNAWADLAQEFSPRFTNFPATPGEAVNSAPISLSALGGQSETTIEFSAEQGVLRLQFLNATCDGLLAQNRAFQAENELSRLQHTITAAPYPIWHTDAEGEVCWANAAYKTLLRSAAPQTDLKSETSPIFDIENIGTGAETKSRVVIDTDNLPEPLWFEVTSAPFDAGRIHCAVAVDAVVKAEIAQRNFVQTLTKTFAQLSIGLAIFDRNRQLALFNPALIDLTSLPASFLSARPDLPSFFDHLRDNRMMPEPKNYASWRQQITDLVTAASDGRYQETWTLASGLTYRISGRPHPDGAVAFLFEDISAEVSLTRRFRAQLDLNQSVLDTLDDAIAVFTQNGTLGFCNVAYSRLWGIDPDTQVAEITISDAMRVWQTSSMRSPIWGDLRSFVLGQQDRSEWFADIKKKDKTSLECRFSPLSGGATMVAFSLKPVLDTALKVASDA